LLKCGKRPSHYRTQEQEPVWKSLLDETILRWESDIKLRIIVPKQIEKTKKEKKIDYNFAPLCLDSLKKEWHEEDWSNDDNNNEKKEKKDIHLIIDKYIISISICCFYPQNKKE